MATSIASPTIFRASKTAIRNCYSDSGVMILEFKQGDIAFKSSVTGKTGDFVLRGDGSDEISMDVALLDKIHKLASSHFQKVTTLQSKYKTVR